MLALDAVAEEAVDFLVVAQIVQRHQGALRILGLGENAHAVGQIGVQHGRRVLPNLPELTAKWQESARSSLFQTFVFDDAEVKNEIAAMGEIFNTDYKLLTLGFTDDPAGDIARLRDKMEAAGANKPNACPRCRSRRGC